MPDATVPVTGTVRPRRSVLYLPGSNPRALDKAKTLPADGLILDLEDAVATDAKEMARAQVLAALRGDGDGDGDGDGGFGGRELVVRVNGLDTPWGHADLVAAARSGADAVLLPKVDGPDALRLAERVLDGAGAPPGLALWAMMETPRAILNAREIAGCGGRLACLVVGSNDLSKDLRAVQTADRLPLLASLSLVLLAARAYGLAALDGVHLDLKDAAGLDLACRQGRELGFDGKTLIHPDQIAAANAAFAPSEAEMDKARRLIAAHETALAAGKAVTTLDGKLVEALHVTEARRVLALAAAVAGQET